MEEGPDGTEIDVDDAVGLGQQARSLGRGFGAQEDGHAQQKQDRANDEERTARASVHLGPSELPYHFPEECPTHLSRALLGSR